MLINYKSWQSCQSRIMNTEEQKALCPQSIIDRVFNCQECGHSQDRDENAAINLENAPEDKVRLA
jgi:transposase